MWRRCLFLSNLIKQTCTGVHSVNIINCRMSSLLAPFSGNHEKSRDTTQPYKRSKAVRFNVPDDKVSWKISFPEYKPVEYTDQIVLSAPWADPIVENKDFHPKWNVIDGKIDRTTHQGPYQVTGGRPLNIIGRTGITGRGCLGKWGPNHAADPVVTRWKRDEKGTKETNAVSGLPVLQFVAIERRDCHEWAIPGGMIDPGEQVSATLRREFGEETFNSLEMSAEEKHHLENQLAQFFAHGRDVYRGYVDDPRNTDNAWMETVAINFHDESGNSAGKFKLQAGDDAVGVQWMDIDKNMKLYASHRDFIEAVAKFHKAHW